MMVHWWRMEHNRIQAWAVKHQLINIYVHFLLVFCLSTRPDHPSPPTPQDKMSKEEIIRSLQAAESYWEKGSYVAPAPDAAAEQPRQHQQHRLSRSTHRRSNDLNNGSASTGRKEPTSSSSKESSPLNSSSPAAPSSMPTTTAAAVPPPTAPPVHPSSRSPFVVESMSDDKVRYWLIDWWLADACLMCVYVTECNVTECYVTECIVK